MKKNKKKMNMKFCNWCKGPLVTFKEKFTRTCDTCARDTKDAANDMAHGRFKEGKDKIKNVFVGKVGHIEDECINKAMNKKQKTIVKLLKKQGVSEEEALQGIKDLKA